MLALEWEERYNVGIRRMDRQHRQVLAILNDLYNLDSRQVRREKLGRIFDRLRYYIQRHFWEEEALMRANGYPGYELQKLEHHRFIDQVCAYQQDFVKGRRLAEINLFNAVWDWFAGHILRVDKEYGPFFRDRGVR